MITNFVFTGVSCNDKDVALLCSLCGKTEDGCHGDCAFDPVLNRCYKRGKLIQTKINRNSHIAINIIRVTHIKCNLTKGYDFIEIKLNGMRDVPGANWGKLHECPTGSFIDGFDVAYHPLVGMTSISAECADKDGNTVGSVRSLVCPVKSFFIIYFVSMKMFVILLIFYIDI